MNSSDSQLFRGDQAAASSPARAQGLAATGVFRGWKVFLPLVIFAASFYTLVAAILLGAGYPFNCLPERELEIVGLVLGGYLLPSVLALWLIPVAKDMILQIRGLPHPPLSQRVAQAGRVLVWSWALGLVFLAVKIPYVNLKPAVPLLNPVNHDAQLESIERALFGGVLPSEWLVAHCSSAALYFWDLIYQLFLRFLFVSLAITLFCQGLRGGARLVLSLSIGLLLHALIMLLCPTRGPIFVHPEWFGGLQELSSGRLSGFLLYSVEQYRDNPGRTFAVSGISAMPSYHVFAWTCGLLAWRSLPRWVVMVGLILTALNWVSTVVLGWHYALDGLVGTVLALLVWWLADKLIPRVAQQE